MMTEQIGYWLGCSFNVAGRDEPCEVFKFLLASPDDDPQACDHALEAAREHVARRFPGTVITLRKAVSCECRAIDDAPRKSVSP